MRGRSVSLPPRRAGSRDHAQDRWALALLLAVAMFGTGTGTTTSETVGADTTAAPSGTQRRRNHRRRRRDDRGHRDHAHHRRRRRGAAGGGSLVVALNDLASLDNSQAVSTIDYDMTAKALYEGLYHFTSEGELEPGLATGPSECQTMDSSTPSPSRRRHVRRARLRAPWARRRRGVRDDPRPRPEHAPTQSWGRGVPLPHRGAQEFAGGEAEEVSRIEVIDDQTLQVTLADPTSTFIFGLTIATMAGTPGGGGGTGRGFRQPPGGAGPSTSRNGTEVRTSPSCAIPVT